MPSRPARPCRVTSCPNKVKGSVAYCPKHKHLAPTGWSAKKDREHQKFYHTKRWRQTSKQYRNQNPVCVHCKEKGIIRSAELVDHIIPIQDGGDRYDWDNLQSLCNSCHNSKTAKETAKRQNQ